MPFPKGAKGKGEAAGAQDGDGLCGLCGRQVDKDEPWIEGTCSHCGTRPFCFECVADFMEKEVRCMDLKGNRKSDKNMLYARQYPQNIFARNCHIMSRKPVCPGTLGAKDCPGLMDTAELIRPHKQAQEAAPALAPPPVPAKKQRQQQPAQAGTPKPVKPAKLAAAPGAPASPPLANRTSSAGSMASSASTSAKLAPAPSRPGGGAAAVLGSSKLDGERGAPTFAQLQLMEQKARQREQREQRQRAAAAARAQADGSAGAGSTAHLEADQRQQQRSLSSNNTWDAPAGGSFGGAAGAEWGAAPGFGVADAEFDPDLVAMMGGGVAAAAGTTTTANNDYSLADWPGSSAGHPSFSEDADMAAAIAASLADVGCSAASWPASAAADSFGHEQWAAQPAAAAPAPAGPAPALHGGDGDDFDGGFAAGLAAALREQHDRLQREWAQQAGQEDVWQQQQQQQQQQGPPAVAAPVPEIEAQAQVPAAVWEHGQKAPLSSVQGRLPEQQGDAEVDELLALMGIS